MKKSIIKIIVALSLLLLLVGCNTNNISNDIARKENNNSHYKTERGEIPLTTIEDYQDYLKAVDSLPDTVIRYDTIKEIGQFESFVVLSGGKNGSYSQYMYKVKDASAFSVYVTITDTNMRKNKEYEVLAAEYDVFDMRTIKEAKTGIIEINGVYYLFAQGKLVSISWVIENIEYRISGHSLLNEYPIDNKSTFVSKLINSETAIMAVSELMSN